MGTTPQELMNLTQEELNYIYEKYNLAYKTFYDAKSSLETLMFTYLNATDLEKTSMENQKTEAQTAFNEAEVNLDDLKVKLKAKQDELNKLHLSFTIARFTTKNTLAANLTIALISGFDPSLKRTLAAAKNIFKTFDDTQINQSYLEYIFDMYFKSIYITSAEIITQNVYSVLNQDFDTVKFENSIINVDKNTFATQLIQGYNSKTQSN